VIETLNLGRLFVTFNLPTREFCLAAAGFLLAILRKCAEMDIAITRTPQKTEVRYTSGALYEEALSSRRWLARRWDSIRRRRRGAATWTLLKFV
jgi:hypothetical protein